MLSSIFLTAALAVGTLAGPIRKRDGYVYTVVDWVDVTVTKCVTEYGYPSLSAAAAEVTTKPWAGHKHSYAPKPVTSTPAAVPSSAAPVVPASSAAPTYTPASSSAAPVSSAAPTTSQTSSGGNSHVTGTAEGDLTSGPDYENMVLFHHNIHRANHSADALTWNQTLADSAYALAKFCEFRHDSVGQNLAGSAPNANVSGGLTDGWYNNEIENYNPYYGMDTPTGDLELYGHATQMIWKDSKTVGCATYDCRGAALGMWFTVCNYFPAGNVSPKWDSNLSKGQGAPVATWTS
ncbi:PR-1-like protein [Cenococcum geophilum 1.58]|uniref:PR-1-like protein n=1 Tax=Cenococcum geophilum 1.58 TaxID=794803 RepID=UPI00358F59F2|nr:PR-1-like protein [Cenococcum geophilum 1.58]